MTEITINPAYIFGVIYATFKVIASVWICKREFQYPIWNSDGLQIQRGIQHKLQSFLRNWVINPEWGLLKLIAFAPVFIVTGKRFIHSFMPWRVQKTPPFCKKCKDKGKYFVNSFLVGKSSWTHCDCQLAQPPEELPACSCYVCLDKGTIGRNRPCPHCKRRRELAPVPNLFEEHGNDEGLVSCGGCGQRFTLWSMKKRGGLKINEKWFCVYCVTGALQVEAAAKESLETTVPDRVQGDSIFDVSCKGCGCLINLLARSGDIHIDGSWFCGNCSSVCTGCGNTFVVPKEWKDKRYKWCPDCYKTSYFEKVIAPNGTKLKELRNPHRYLDHHDTFCGDPNKMKKCSSWHVFPDRACKRVLSKLHVGETIFISSICSGHRNEDIIGKPLRILGLNLPFAAVGYDFKSKFSSSSRQYVESIDLRGMTLYGNSLPPSSDLSPPTLGYRPLLDPTTLVVGDKFVVLRLTEKGTDASFRGEAFRVVKPVHLGGAGKLVFACQSLSFNLFVPTQLTCEGLQIIAVNDQYVQATKTNPLGGRKQLRPTPFVVE